MEAEDRFHVPVMGKEVIELLIDDPDGIYIDGTAGNGGHTRLIVDELSENGKVIACDLDRRMLEMAEKRLGSMSSRVEFYNCGYHQVAERIPSDYLPVSGYLLDLGICSVQLDRQLGFAFKADNPLDMRFDSGAPLTAADIVNTYSYRELKQLFREYGELKQASRIAEEICEYRQRESIETTRQLASIVAQLFPQNRRSKGLARIGQALRIAVNSELDNLRQGLASLTGSLKSGGRMVVLSYHSLEDRIVKNFIRSHSRESGLPPELEEVLDRRDFRLKNLTSKAMTASREELEVNKRARSARLRAAAKV